MEEREKLEKLHKEIKKCKKCPLWREARNPVPGEGPASAKLIFIGESPGREEDLTGRPFIGRAGKLLDELLKKNRINRKKVFITSVIKHRPPKNRQPKKSELKACRNWWGQQIEIINPQLIVLLGKVAFDTVIDEGKIFNKYRGKFLIKNRRQHFTTYHPAAGLRFPKIKKTLEKDFHYISIS